MLDVMARSISALLMEQQSAETTPERRAELQTQIDSRRANNRERQRRFVKNHPEYRVRNEEVLRADRKRRARIRSLQSQIPYYQDRIDNNDRADDARQVLADIRTTITELENPNV
ncbi:hypothetical protein [Curtobacterium phage Parvaparticeps]|nr:hypothetical protein [Curtobacterium phage Parvaparticeps]